MTNVLAVVLSAIAAFTVTLSAGIFVRKFKSNIGIVCAFTSGFFIALSFFDLLPNLVDLFSNSLVPLEGVMLVGVGGFLFLLVLNRGFSRFHTQGHHVMKGASHPRIGLLSTIEFCSHAFIEGLAIGVGFQAQFALGVFVTIAVVSHDFCDGISTLALMLNSGNTLRSSLAMLLVCAVAPVLGASATLFLTIQNSVLIYMLAFLFGSFLYIGGGMLLPDAYSMIRPKMTFILFSIGFFLVVLATLIAN